MIQSIEKYRIFDLALLSLLATIAEVAGEVLHDKLPGAGYYLSFSMLIAIIAMIRWGIWGSLVYVISGIPMIFLHHDPENIDIFKNILLYPISYVFIVIAAVYFKIINRNDIKNNRFYLLTYTLFSYICVSLGKGFSTYILSGNFWEASVNTVEYLVIHAFNIVMVYIVLLIIRGRKGLLVNMDKYVDEIRTNSK